MLENLHKMYKKNPIWAYVVLFLSGSILILIPKMLFFSSQSPVESSEPLARIKLLLPFLIGCGIGIIFLSKTVRSKLFSKKSEPNVSERSTKSKSLPVEEKNAESKTHQQILDEMGEYLWALKKHKFWTIGCLIVGWIVFFLARWFDIGSQNSAAFTTAVFLLALLLGTKNLEKEHDLDKKIVVCTLRGIQLEKKNKENKSQFFHGFAKNYEGWGMVSFSFTRVSPALMIVYSMCNYGIVPFFPDYSDSPIMHIGIGVVLAAGWLFFGNLACGPYRQLLEKAKNRSLQNHF